MPYTLNILEFSLLQTKKESWIKILENLKTTQGMNSNKQKFWAGYEKQNGEYISFVTKKLIIKQFHHLTIQQEDKKLNMYLNAYLTYYPR